MIVGGRVPAQGVWAAEGQWCAARGAGLRAQSAVCSHGLAGLCWRLCRWRSKAPWFESADLVQFRVQQLSADLNARVLALTNWLMFALQSQKALCKLWGLLFFRGMLVRSCLMFVLVFWVRCCFSQMRFFRGIFSLSLSPNSRLKTKGLQELPVSSGGLTGGWMERFWKGVSKEREWKGEERRTLNKAAVPLFIRLLVGAARFTLHF